MNLDLTTIERQLTVAFIARFGVDLGRSVTTETMAWAGEHQDKLSMMKNPAGYLFRLGQSTSRKRLRSTTGDNVSSASPSSATSALLAALGQLDEQQRTPLVLVHSFQWTDSEVAGLLGISSQTVQTRLDRGLAQLRDNLAGEQSGEPSTNPLDEPALKERLADYGEAVSEELDGSTTASSDDNTAAPLMGTKMQVGDSRRRSRIVLAAVAVLALIGVFWLSSRGDGSTVDVVAESSIASTPTVEDESAGSQDQPAEADEDSEPTSSESDPASVPLNADEEADANNDADEGDQEPSESEPADTDTEEPDTNEASTTEPDTNDTDTEEPDTDEASTNEPDTEESDANERQTDEPDSAPDPQQALTCDVGELVDGQCMIVGDPPASGPGRCPVSETVLTDSEGCYEIVEPSVFCDGLEIFDADSCRRPVDRVATSESCPSGYTLRSDDRTCVRADSSASGSSDEFECITQELGGVRCVEIDVISPVPGLVCPQDQGVMDDGISCYELVPRNSCQGLPELPASTSPSQAGLRCRRNIDLVPGQLVCDDGFAFQAGQCVRFVEPG